jgi:hypothetical protein
MGLRNEIELEKKRLPGRQNVMLKTEDVACPYSAIR